MLRDDPILTKFPEYLPTEEEVSLAEDLLRQPEHEALRADLSEHIAIGGCPTASLWRFCWQARQDRKFGQECARGALEWANRCAAARRRLKMDSILSACPFPSDFQALYMDALPFSCHGADRDGRPLFIARYGRMNVEAFKRVWDLGEKHSEAEGLGANAAVLVHLRAMEYVTKIVMAEQSALHGRVVDRMMAVFDMSGLGLAHIQSPLKIFFAAVVKESIPLFPETLHKTIVAHSPWVFSCAAWPLCKPFLHPVTQAKLLFPASMSELRRSLLESFDNDRLPPYLGGSCACDECSAEHLRGGSLWQWDRIHSMGHSQDQTFSDRTPAQDLDGKTSGKTPLSGKVSL